METIIALLFVLLPIVFKLIGKRLEKSGKMDQAARMREVARELGMDPKDEEFIKMFHEAEAEAERVARLEAAGLDAWDELPENDDESSDDDDEPLDTLPKLKVDPEVKKVEKFVPKGAKKMPILKEEEPKPKEKVDPKKLVVYSEIIKPKYTE